MNDDIELHARSGDPSTSHDAMGSLDKARMGKASDCVVALYRQFGPMPDYELQHRFATAWQDPCCAHLYRQARSIARDRGQIRDSGKKVHNPQSGRQQILWEACYDPSPVIRKCHACGHVIRRDAALNDDPNTLHDSEWVTE